MFRPFIASRIIMNPIPSQAFARKIHHHSNHRPILRCWSASSVSSSSSSAESLTSSANIQLYQYAICPFCNQVKALLDHAGFEYRAVEVNPLTKAEIRPLSKHYRKVPIAMINGQAVFGANEIVAELLQLSELQTRLQDQWQKSSGTTTNTTMMTWDQFQGESTQPWVHYAREELALLLYPNICRTWSDAHLAFGYVNHTPTFGPWQRFWIRQAGSLAMYMAASRIKKKRQITDERQALDAALQELEDKGLHQGEKKFLSGLDDPHLGDLAVFGVLRSIHGLPAHQQAVYERSGPIPAWYDRMMTTSQRRPL